MRSRPHLIMAFILVLRLIGRGGKKQYEKLIFYYYISFICDI